MIGKRKLDSASSYAIFLCVIDRGYGFSKICFTLFLVIIFSCEIIVAQTNSSKYKARKVFLFDSLKQKLITDSLRIYRFKKLRPYLAIDNRNSFIKNAPVNIYGFQAGVILNERHTLCLGEYTISKAAQKPTTLKGQTIETLRSLSLNYLTVFYQYTLIDKRFFELDVPLEVGIGKYEIKLTASATEKVLYEKKHAMVPLGAGLQAIVKPFKWIGFSSMLGYRYVTDVDPNLNFNGWFYAYGVWVDVRQVVRDTRYYIIKKPKYKKNVSYLKTKA